MIYYRSHIAKLTKVNIETIRYYENIGLLPAPERSNNGYRVYNDATIKKLCIIKYAKSCGFTLWYSMPAILKGFIDQVFVPGFAYVKKGKLPKGLLQDKTAWVVYTIDSPKWFVKLFRKSIEWKSMKNTILKFCGISSAKRFMFTNATNSTPQKREKWLYQIYDKARKFDQYRLNRREI